MRNLVSQCMHVWMYSVCAYWSHLGMLIMIENAVASCLGFTSHEDGVKLSMLEIRQARAFRIFAVRAAT